ncbi:MAG: MarR family winged helix-turn-helix transcriptional regulator [Dokdonella sp.]|jgi:DNA-binding MarR family transcriptional regulator|uniref:MarR family winged helix-turn-helix transcriptional regulator n=1 Tax=Dokdonella sp. TaxID=2291710 RepID=UPI003F7CE1D8
MIKTTDNTFAYLLHDVTRLMRKHFDRRATRLELTRAQWRALKVIGRHEGLSQAELAEYLDMEPIPVGRVVDRLEKTGFVQRRADPADRRRWRLHLTAKAHAIVDEMEVIGAALREEALRGVAPADFEALLRVLARLKDNLVALDDEPAHEQREAS